MELLRGRIQQAAPSLGIADAVAEAARLQTEAAAEIEAARKHAAAEVDLLRKESRDQVRVRIEKAEAQLSLAGSQANQIIDDANRRAAEIAGDAFKALDGDLQRFNRLAVTEPEEAYNPELPERLEAGETAAFLALSANRYGIRVRIEQERLPYSALEEAINRLSQLSPPDR